MGMCEDMVDLSEEGLLPGVTVGGVVEGGSECGYDVEIQQGGLEDECFPELCLPEMHESYNLKAS